MIKVTLYIELDCGQLLVKRSQLPTLPPTDSGRVLSAGVSYGVREITVGERGEVVIELLQPDEPDAAVRESLLHNGWRISANMSDIYSAAQV